jgi:hypothetical protein
MAKTTKLLINGEAGVGKTTLVKDLVAKDTLAIAIDGKDFPLNIPHATYKENVTVDELIKGYTVDVDELVDGKIQTREKEVPGIVDVVDRYVEQLGQYPKNIVLDSVSKLANNIIEKGNTDFTNFDIHNHIKKDLGLVNAFISEYLEPRCENLILINHVVVKDGEYQQTGSGNFKDKGGFYAEVDEALTVVASSDKKRKVITNGKKFQARTLLDLPLEIPIPYIHPDPAKCDEVTDEHFNLQKHLDLLNENKHESEEWSLI